MTHQLRLTIVDQQPTTVGRFGCDYAWNNDFTAYRCMPHRWDPQGGDAAYAAYQAGDIEDGDDGFLDWAYAEQARTGRLPARPKAAPKAAPAPAVVNDGSSDDIFF